MIVIDPIIYLVVGNIYLDVRNQPLCLLPSTLLFLSTGPSFACDPGTEHRTDREQRATEEEFEGW